MLHKDQNGALKISGNAFPYGLGNAQKKGWYFDFLSSETTGERSVTHALVANGRLYFNSLIPGTDPCATGAGRSYALDALTGLLANDEATGFLSQVGLLSSPVRLEIGDAKTSDRNALGRRTVRKRQAIVNFGTGGEQGTAAAEHGVGESIVPAGRFSWREVANWPELRNAAKK